jgi:hypothetical protein
MMGKGPEAPGDEIFLGPVNLEAKSEKGLSQRGGTALFELG